MSFKLSSSNTNSSNDKSPVLNEEEEDEDTNATSTPATSTLTRKNINTENDLLKFQKHSTIIMNATQLNASIPTLFSAVSSKDIDQFKDLSGSSSNSFDNHSHELTSNSSSNPNQSFKSINQVSNNSKSNQIVEAVSNAANATSEALSNLISSTESTSKHSYSITPEDKVKLEESKVASGKSSTTIKKNQKEKSKKPWYSVSIEILLFGPRVVVLIKKSMLA